MDVKKNTLYVTRYVKCLPHRWVTLTAIITLARDDSYRHRNWAKFRAIANSSIRRSLRIGGQIHRQLTLLSHHRCWIPAALSARHIKMYRGTSASIYWHVPPTGRHSECKSYTHASLQHAPLSRSYSNPAINGF